MKRHRALAYLLIGLALMVAPITVILSSSSNKIGGHLIRSNASTHADTQQSPATTFTVITTADLGMGSLRDAINQANGSPGTDLINFNAGLGTINVGNTTGLPLPDITDAVTIDGGSPRIELNGSTAGAGANGLSILAAGVTVRGLVINRFAGVGILVEDNNSIIQNNFIGTDSTGVTALPNAGGGVTINGNGNLIGGATPSARNVISGNGQFGVRLGSTASNNTVEGNLIGTDVTGSNPLSNDGGIGVRSSANNNMIGGIVAGAGNVIAFSLGTGVAHTAGDGNAILGNSIFENGSFPIDISDDTGVTPNDLCDVDTGANSLQNFPVLTSAISGVSSTTISGTLDSTMGTPFRIEFFSNPSCDASGNGEGQTFIGATTVNTPAVGCVVTINATVPVAVPAGSVITATATDPSNNTSEFSGCVTVSAGGTCTLNCPDLFLPTLPGATSCGRVVTFAPTATCGTVSCAPPSGSVFAVGTTTVNCTVIDGPSCSFDVTVVDETPPSITCPTGVTANLAGLSTVVNYPAPTATDNCTTPTVTCAPPSGSSFPAGSTLVTCTARDAFENLSRCFFFVTVFDSQPPVITCPANVSALPQSGQNSAVVNYPAPTASDNLPGVTVLCSPPSGSSFPLGSTTVTCTATDAGGNKASCSFTVGVGAAQARVTIPGNKTVLEFEANPRRKPPKPKNSPCVFFTIDNVGFAPLTLTFDSLRRTGSDVTSGRISDPNDVNGVPESTPTKFFTLFRVNADQSLTQLSTGQSLTPLQPGQGQLFCTKFAALIPGLAGKSTGLAATDVLPNLLTSTLTFRPNAGSNVEIPISARVSTGVQLVNLTNRRAAPEVLFARSGDEITVSYAVFDSNLDVTRAKYEFLNANGQVIAGPFEIDFASSISSANLVKGQSFRVDQKFTGANSNTDVTGVRVTVFDGESSANSISSALASSLSALNSGTFGGSFFREAPALSPPTGKLR